jgi:DNA-directed RNA polymerase subunit RPC12/RpoP
MRTVKNHMLQYWSGSLAIMFAMAALRATCLEIAETAVPPGELAEYECPGCRGTFQLPVPQDGTAPNCPVCGSRERLTLLGPSPR